MFPHTYRNEHFETITTNSLYGEFYRRLVDVKIRIQDTLLKILQYVDANREALIQDLADVVSIQSISGDPKHRGEVLKMIKFVESWLVRLGIRYECFKIGTYEIDGKEYKLPPVIMGQYGHDPRKPTLCVYTYLDVPIPKRKAWNTCPFTLIKTTAELYASGVASGKCALISWFHVLQAFQHQDVELPVNLRFCIESMYYQNSEGLEPFIAKRGHEFFPDVDCIVFSDSEWIGEKYPCLCYGGVGMLHFSVTVEKSKDSEVDIKEDMEKLFATIADDKENILIPNFNEFVLPITPDEEALYESVEGFDPEEIRDQLPPHMKNWDQLRLLKHFWRLPSIFVDNIEECICEKKDTSKIKRHFVIKIVPRQVVDVSVPMVLNHIEKTVKELKITNKVECKVLSVTRPWLENFMFYHYEAARRAIIQIYKEDPSMIREDRDRKTLTDLGRITEKKVLLLPLGRKGMNAGRPNENISLKNFFEGTKVIAAFLFQFAALNKSQISK